MSCQERQERRYTNYASPNVRFMKFTGEVLTFQRNIPLDDPVRCTDEKELWFAISSIASVFVVTRFKVQFWKITEKLSQSVPRMDQANLFCAVGYVKSGNWSRRLNF